MATNVCPFCNAARWTGNYTLGFECGSPMALEGKVYEDDRTHLCHSRQVTQLKATVERLEQFKADLLKAYHDATSADDFFALYECIGTDYDTAEIEREEGGAPSPEATEDSQ